MESELNVYMNSTHCGMLEQSSTGNLTFTYEQAYLDLPNPTPLSLSMPLSFATHPKRAVLPYLNGLITDNYLARKAIANYFEVSFDNPFAILEHIGRDAPGAIQLLPAGTKLTKNSLSHQQLTPLSDSQISKQLHDTIEEFRHETLTGPPIGRFSLPGAQPKIALTQTPQGQWLPPNDSMPTSHILKPVSGGYKRIDVVEHMTMTAAANLGLNVAESELRTFGDIRTFITRRYDRELRDGTWHRLHQEDLCQALSVDPVKKYQEQDGGPGVGKIAQLFQGLDRKQDRDTAAWSFFQGLMFNVMLQCPDAHAKNYSLLLNGDSVALAPLYDLITIAPYLDHDSQPKSAMKIGDHYRFSRIGLKQCLSAASVLKIDHDQAQSFINYLQKNAVGAFEEARDNLRDTDQDTAEFAHQVLASVAALRHLTS